jgi:hypothetical protein
MLHKRVNCENFKLYFIKFMKLCVDQNESAKSPLSANRHCLTKQVKQNKNRNGDEKSMI